ncbi:gem-associated 2-like [Paramuricea clavata]|uniref:Gem-associated protein 2 n=1 Tax=Paramuricea clavata TaxID=317549 RepID=A0A7D9ECG4_PARCT|nr:gem-associated 2-like [Paramuricea clavata]
MNKFLLLQKSDRSVNNYLECLPGVLVIIHLPLSSFPICSEMHRFSPLCLQFLAHQKALLKEKKVKKRKLPDAENEQQWFQLCFGKKQQTTTAQCKRETQDTVSSIQTEVEHSGGTPALLSIICQMNQSTVLTVLDHHVGWLETQPFTLLQGQWIHALLTAVEKPLLPDTTYSLRRLARLCAKQKESLTPEQTDEMAALYLIIILVMRYFGQSDLAETL